MCNKGSSQPKCPTLSKDCDISAHNLANFSPLPAPKESVEKQEQFGQCEEREINSTSSPVEFSNSSSCSDIDPSRRIIFGAYWEKSSSMDSGSLSSSYKKVPSRWEIHCQASLSSILRKPSSFTTTLTSCSSLTTSSSFDSLTTLESDVNSNSSRSLGRKQVRFSPQVHAVTYRKDTSVGSYDLWYNSDDMWRFQYDFLVDVVKMSRLGICSYNCWAGTGGGHTSLMSEDLSKALLQFEE